MASKWNRAAAWVLRVCLLAAVLAVASGNGAVSAEPPQPLAPQSLAGAETTVVPAAIPSRALGIAAQDSWLGE